MGKEKDGWEIMAGRKPEFDIPPDGYETAPVAVADDAPPDGYEGPSTGYKGVGASGSWDQPQPAVVPQPVVPHIQMPQNPDAMSTYKEALTAYLVGNRDLAKAKAEAALSLDTGLTGSEKHADPDARQSVGRDKRAEAGIFTAKIHRLHGRPNGGGHVQRY
ncbi:MAG: hypothetical protein IPN23_10800 [Elusimicrobia bacterium]|nr:hypothetical protein [Elusimicrobiota bacterium]